jgi:hypothetical protein
MPRCAERRERVSLGDVSKLVCIHSVVIQGVTGRESTK